VEKKARYFGFPPYRLLEDIKQKHKFRLEAVKKDEPLLMYGVKVGIANQAIKKGTALTTENMDNAFNENISFENTGKSKVQSPAKTEKFFMGYPRIDGTVGTQNIWLFFPLVFCEIQKRRAPKNCFRKRILSRHLV
jgi:altronate hydrolase